MCMFSSEDIKRAIQRAYDMLRPLYLFCNPKDFEVFQNELADTIYEVVSSPYVEKNKIIIINKADLKLPFEDSDIPRIDLSKLNQFIDKGGED